MRKKKMIGESRAEGRAKRTARNNDNRARRAAKRWFARGSGEKESFETKKDSLRFGSYVGVSTFRSFVNEYWLNSYFLSTFFRSYDTRQID